MNKQKVCIIGAGLTSLVTAIVMTKCGLFVEIIKDKDNVEKGNISKIRSIAFSNSSFSFLKKLNVFNFNSKFIWPVTEMRIYNLTKNFKLKEIFKFHKKDNILYMLLNKFLFREIKKKIKKIKIKKFKKNIYINDLISQNKYNLVINCTGPNSSVTKNFFSKHKTNFKYNEVAVVVCVKHLPVKNNVARQIFLKEGPLALLPISNTKTSIVWSLKKKYLSAELKKRNKFVKYNLKIYLSTFLKIKSMSTFEYNEINFLISNTYYSHRFLNFGDALHQVHPFVGQGFNMILRDLFIFEKILKSKIKLGLDIGDQTVLDEFSKKRKSQNFAFVIGVDFLKNFFYIKNNFLKKIRNFILKKVNKNIFIKKKLFKIANEGLNF